MRIVLLRLAPYGSYAQTCHWPSTLSCSALCPKTRTIAIRRSEPLPPTCSLHRRISRKKSARFLTERGTAIRKGSLSLTALRLIARNLYVLPRHRSVPPTTGERYIRPLRQNTRQTRERYIRTLNQDKKSLP